jgi:hypothetical protein
MLIVYQFLDNNKFSCKPKNLTLLVIGLIIIVHSITKEFNMAKTPKQQTTSDLQRTLAGQWTKTEKRAEASRQIMASKKKTHEVIKAFRNAQILAR